MGVTGYLQIESAALAASSCEIVVIVMVICCADMGFPWREGQSGLCFHQSSFINRCQKKENGIERKISFRAALLNKTKSPKKKHRIIPLGKSKCKSK